MISDTASFLDSTRRSATPGAALAAARSACEAIRSKLAGKISEVVLKPLDEGLLMVFSTDTGCDVKCLVEYGGEFSFLFESPDTNDVHPPLSLTVPDEVEAIHMAGIVFDSLRPRSILLGERSKEHNRSILSQTPANGIASGAMDRCDYRYAPGASPRISLFKPGTVLSREKTYTHEEFFTWACHAVKQLRRDLGKPRAEASIWAYRTMMSPDAWFEGAGPRRPEVPCGVLVFEVRVAGSEHSEPERRKPKTKAMQLNFMQAMEGASGVSLSRVHSLMHAMHIVGMTIEAMGITITDIGSRHYEANPAVMARMPVQPNRIGQMVRAENYVSGLEGDDG